MNGLSCIRLWSGTIETRSAMGNLAAENLTAHFAGKPLLTPLNY
jgi:hypothetical protein